MCKSLKSWLIAVSTIVAIICPLSAANADEQASQELQEILDAHWAWELSQNPTFATTLGVHDYDDRLGSRSLAAYDAKITKSKEFAAALDAIDVSDLTPEEAINRDLLLLMLNNEIEGAQFGGKFLLMTNRYGPHTDVARLPDRLPFFTLANFESYVTRLGDVPRYLNESIETLRAGAEAGWTQPCAPMARVEAAIRFHAVEDVSQSVFLKPFEKKPATINERAWRRLKNRATKTIEGDVLPSISAFADFYRDEYSKSCRADMGASALPDGNKYYAHRARVFTTTDQTPDEIHQLGLSEVKRIRAEMQRIIDDVGFDGDFKSFQELLRSDPKFYAQTEEDLVNVVSTISKRIDGELPNLFTRLPRMPYTVKPVPADIAEGATTAYYERPAGDGSRAGVYRINTSFLDQRPLFELEALTLHEAVPGHHFQIALAQELSLPEFRKYRGFTAFTEGWGLYAESLGLDVGFYEDPYQNFGRLSYEMWRACRLVVDTGMHTKGWTREQAIAFMVENTALSTHNIEAEVDRYITWPGQALAYKIGQLKIKELREKASQSLGESFDLRRFHDTVLKNGGVPLSVLEAEIDRWIASEENSK